MVNCTSNVPDEQILRAKIIVDLLLLSGSLKISSQHSTSVNALRFLCRKHLFKWWDKIKMTVEEPGQLVAFQHFMIHFSFFYGRVLWMTHLIQINEILDYLEDIFQKKTQEKKKKGKIKRKKSKKKEKKS